MGSKTVNENLFVFDGEQLAEGGVATAYATVMPLLGTYVAQPARVDEAYEVAARRYEVRSGERKFVVRSPEFDTPVEVRIGRATYALFALVNEQLTAAECDVRFYCVNLGDELQGMFLTVAQAYLARRTLPDKRDWPYLPTDEDPWYGQHH